MMIHRNKKGSLEIDTMGKILVVVIVLIILVLVAYLFKDKIVSMIGQAGKILRFR